jgi:aryl-alcohol dehydrogenase-like predicted oxidoreductase
MKYRALYPGGPIVSRLALGSWHTIGDGMDDAASRNIIRRALDMGINFFDTADIYANGNAEKTLGNALKGISRDQYFLATKCYFLRSSNEVGRLSKKNIQDCVERSLKNFDLEYIDLLQCHRFDLETPIEETINAMDGLIKSGKIKDWGVSRWSPEQLNNCNRIAGHWGLEKLKTTQHFYNIFSRDIERELVGVCEKSGIGVITYSPLAQGILSGKYSSDDPLSGTRSANPERRKMMWDFNKLQIDRAQHLKNIAHEMGVSLATLSLAWCLKNSSVNAIIFGASTINQLEENVAASEFNLADGDYTKINSILEGI